MAAAGIGRALNRIAVLSAGVGFAGYALDQCLFNGACGCGAARRHRVFGLGDRDPPLGCPVSRRFRVFGCAVDGGHRAVIWDRFQGITSKVVGEGTHFRIPFIEVRTDLAR